MATLSDGSFTYYRSVMVYGGDDNSDEHLLYITHPEGITAYDANGNFTYKYFFNDYMGNVRSVAAVDTNTATMIEEQATDYYPFGLAHSYNNLHKNRYLFSGKELQDASVGASGFLGLYDFGARYYNPMLGRWFNIDPALQYTNPYLFCGNAPMMYIDKDGQFAWFIPLIGMGIAALTYTASVACSPGGFNNWSWGSFGQAIALGAISGAITGGIGDVFGAVGSMGLQGEVLRAVSHGFSSMVTSMPMDAQSAGISFFTGMFSSGIGSATSNLPGLAQIGISTLSGGVISEMSGGNFWQGAGTALMIAGLNHGVHAWQELRTNKEKIQAIMSAIYEAKQRGLNVVDLFAAIPGMDSGTSQGYGYGHNYKDKQGRYYKVIIDGEELQVTMLDIGGYKSSSLNIETQYREMGNVMSYGRIPNTNFKFWNSPQAYNGGGREAMTIQVSRASASTFMRIFK